MDLRNVGILLQQYTASQPRRPQRECCQVNCTSPVEMKEE